MHGPFVTELVAAWDVVNGSLRKQAVAWQGFRMCARSPDPNNTLPTRDVLAGKALVLCGLTRQPLRMLSRAGFLDEVGVRV